MSLPPERKFFIGVDFDGTCIIPGKDYPEIREDMPGAVRVLKAFVEAGCQILLITSREGKELDAAVAWFAGHGIPLAGVNENPDPFWKGHRKIFCDVFVDDRNVGIPVTHRGVCEKILNWPEIGTQVALAFFNFLLEKVRE